MRLARRALPGTPSRQGASIFSPHQKIAIKAADSGGGPWLVLTRMRPGIAPLEPFMRLRVSEGHSVFKEKVK